MTGTIALVLLGAVLGALPMPAADSPFAHVPLLPFLLLLGQRVISPFWRTFLYPSAGSVRAAVRARNFALFVFHAAIAGEHGGML